MPRIEPIMRLMCWRMASMLALVFGLAIRSLFDITASIRVIICCMLRPIERIDCIMTDQWSPMEPDAPFPDMGPLPIMPRLPCIMPRPPIIPSPRIIPRIRAIMPRISAIIACMDCEFRRMGMV